MCRSACTSSPDMLHSNRAPPCTTLGRSTLHTNSSNQIHAVVHLLGDSCTTTTLQVPVTGTTVTEAVVLTDRQASELQHAIKRSLDDACHAKECAAL